MSAPDRAISVRPPGGREAPARGGGRALSAAGPRTGWVRCDVLWARAERRLLRRSGGQPPHPRRFNREFCTAKLASGKMKEGMG
mgnify:CR=1 FL=1